MKQNETNVIKITEEMKIPGTDIILEAGDKIQIMNEDPIEPSGGSVTVMGHDKSVSMNFDGIWERESGFVRQITLYSGGKEVGSVVINK